MLNFAGFVKANLRLYPNNHAGCGEFRTPFSAIRAIEIVLKIPFRFQQVAAVPLKITLIYTYFTLILVPEWPLT